jgi:hypothetical protein
VRKLGLDDEGILELMAVVDLFSGFNKLFAYFCYGLSTFAAIFAAIGYFKNKVGKKSDLISLNQ